MSDHAKAPDKLRLVCLERSRHRACAPSHLVIDEPLASALGSKVEIDQMPVMLKRITYTGSTLRTRPPEFKAQIVAGLREKIWPKIAEGRVRVVTSKVIPVEQAARTHEVMQNAARVQKILLDPNA